MVKHARDSSAGPSPNKKRQRAAHATFRPNKVATAEAAAAVDADPPLRKLEDLLKHSVDNPAKGQSVVYWMRMGDLRVSDNRALSLASEQAVKDDIPLIVLFAISPQDYVAYDRSARRIDFTLRNLSKLKGTLADLHIPLHTIIHTPRRTLPSRILTLMADLGSTRLYANMEYEVDELRRDIEICELSKEQGAKMTFVHNKCIVEPGVILTKENKSYAVYSPYQRNWLAAVNHNIPHYLEDCPKPQPNSKSIHKSKKFAPLFDTPVPDVVDGFELQEDDRKRMCEFWPAGEDVASEILQRFLTTKVRSSQLGAVNPLAPGAEESTKSSRILTYDKGRDRVDRDSTSRLSPYLSAGVISVRACVRAAMKLLKTDKVDGSRTSGVGRWIQELAWRDFYTCVLAGFPRVCMGRPYLERFSTVVWEDHQSPEDSSRAAGEGNQDSEMLKKWKEGMTGFPVIDATMRCIKVMGWVHNRMRMTTAMFLTKDLMIDWRVGERYFMENLIDGDFASNNGGWQWSASTGTDPVPYFRLFNPYSQSEKADPSGDFIRHWVPELSKLRGRDLHKPPASLADELGYPRPIVDHAESRERAFRRFKNPGEP
ncbi:putative DNA photolyase [Lyophyllum shimeji]|uniref:DNA photolyase n=1 Tax=Lyophyllum shimeji TaxID=47721 RepID=A0A9P3UK01_LYOSH|nr:putative DNA photolyase [Lyophyllum shimeji]